MDPKETTERLVAAVEQALDTSIEWSAATAPRGRRLKRVGKEVRGT